MSIVFTPDDPESVLKLVTDERVNEYLGYCLFCKYHEGKLPGPPLVALTRAFRQCPVCKRVYCVGA